MQPLELARASMGSKLIYLRSICQHYFENLIGENHDQSCNRKIVQILPTEVESYFV